MRPTNRRVGRPATPSARLAARAVAGREDRGVDTLRHDLDAIGIGAVEADQLVELVARGRDDQVGAAHHLGLHAWAQVDFVADADLGLHPLERMERGDEGKPELVLEAVADGPRHPVVGVEDVVGRAAAFELLAGGVGEGTHEIGELAARYRRAGAGVDVEHPEPGLDDDDGRLLGVLGAGQHVDLHAGTGERRRQGADVHVHAAGVTTARLCER